MKEMKILSTVTFGYEMPDIDFQEGLKWKPDVIVGQGTSTDPGPYYLGHGIGIVPKLRQKRMLTQLLSAAKGSGIPFIASVGFNGSDKTLDWVINIVDEVCREKNLKMRLAVISGEIDKKYLKSKLAKGIKIKRIVETPRLPEYLTTEEVNRSVRIVSQMGPEPVMKALDLGVDGVLTGRALDIGLHMALPLKNGFDKGLAAQMAKTIECGCLCSAQGGFGLVLATLRKDHFLVTPADPEKKCTVTSVAAHGFYERDDPGKELNPGGCLDISEGVYEQYDERTVKVSGGKWTPMPYTIKLEGAAKVGYRTIGIHGVRDPVLLKQIDDVVARVEKVVHQEFADIPGWRIKSRIYGKNGVLGAWEPQKEITSYELCVIFDVVAKTQELATAVCSDAREKFSTINFPGRLTTAGNMASPFSPLENELGKVYMFNIWHALPIDDPCEPFPMRVIDFPRK